MAGAGCASRAGKSRRNVTDTPAPHGRDTWTCSSDGCARPGSPPRRPTSRTTSLDGHIFGFSLWETSHTYTAEEISNFGAKFEQTITADAYPYLHEHAQQHSSEGPHREVSAFEFGLDLIVDGLKKIRDTA